MSGTATVTKAEDLLVLERKESTFIPVNVEHRLENRKDEDLIIIEVQTGDYLGEDDIIRLEDNYGR